MLVVSRGSILILCFLLSCTDSKEFIKKNSVIEARSQEVLDTEDDFGENIQEMDQENIGLFSTDKSEYTGTVGGVEAALQAPSMSFIDEKIVEKEKKDGDFHPSHVNWLVVGVCVAGGALVLVGSVLLLSCWGLKKMQMRGNSGAQQMRGNSGAQQMRGNSEAQQMRGNSGAQQMRGNSDAQQMSPLTQVQCDTDTDVGQKGSH